jgi:hypothetical protein
VFIRVFKNARGTAHLDRIKVLLKQAAEKEREQEKEKENLRRQLKIIMEIDPKEGSAVTLID